MHHWSIEVALLAQQTDSYANIYLVNSYQQVFGIRPHTPQMVGDLQSRSEASSYHMLSAPSSWQYLNWNPDPSLIAQYESIPLISQATPFCTLGQRKGRPCVSATQPFLSHSCNLDSIQFLGKLLPCMVPLTSVISTPLSCNSSLCNFGTRRTPSLVPIKTFIPLHSLELPLGFTPPKLH